MAQIDRIMRDTLALQRAALEIEPIHAEPGPVRRYAAQMAEIKGHAHHVLTIPAGSAAYMMGLRYVSIPDDELAHYLDHGATLAP